MEEETILEAGSYHCLESRMGLRDTTNPFFIPRPETIAAAVFFKKSFEQWLVAPSGTGPRGYVRTKNGVHHYVPAFAREFDAS